MRYVILIEEGPNNFSAYAPDVPGCVATGKTLEETKRQMKEALEFHFEGMVLDGEPVPQATTRCAYVDINMNEIRKRVQRENKPVG
jgi:predicted RNase H-like HicB family nuclease